MQVYRTGNSDQCDTIFRRFMEKYMPNISLSWKQKFDDCLSEPSVVPFLYTNVLQQSCNEFYNFETDKQAVLIIIHCCEPNERLSLEYKPEKNVIPIRYSEVLGICYECQENNEAKTRITNYISEFKTKYSKNVQVIYCADEENCTFIFSKYIQKCRDVCQIHWIVLEDVANRVFEKPIVILCLNSPNLQEKVDDILGRITNKEIAVMLAVILWPDEEDFSKSLSNKRIDFIFRVICRATSDSEQQFINWTKMANNDFDSGIEDKHSEACDSKMDVAAETENIYKVNGIQVVCSSHKDFCQHIFSKCLQKFSKWTVSWETDGANVDLNNPIILLCLKNSNLREDILVALQNAGFTKEARVMLVVIVPNECDVTPEPIPDMDFCQIICEDVYILYSNSREEFYPCQRNHNAIQKIGEWLRKYDATRMYKQMTPSKSFWCWKKHKHSEYTTPILQVVSKTNSNECRRVFLDFMRSFMPNRQIQYLDSAMNIKKDERVVVLCLRISRLQDDISETLRAANVSDQKVMLVILHSCEVGVSPENLPSSVQDYRVHSLTNILYSETKGCYTCKENDKAKSDITRWIHLPN